MAKKKKQEVSTDKESKKKVTPEEAEEVREDISYFPGGLPIDLSQETGENRTLEDELKHHITTVLDDEVRSHAELLERLEAAQKQYRGELPPKNWPWPKCSNRSIPVTRWLVDNIVVRLITTIFGQKKLWTLRARKPELTDLVYDLEDGLEWWQKWVVDLKTKLYDPIVQCIKTGTGIVKITYENKKKAIYRYATQEEINDPKIKKYRTMGDPIVKVPVIKYQGPNIQPIPREDFIISSEAKSIDDAYIVGFRTYFRKAQIEARVRAGLYRRGILSKLYSGDEFDDVKKDRAEGQGHEISDLKEKPIELWELWFKYDVDGDGIEDDIVVVFHRETRSILRAIYNPDFYGSRPFEDLVAYPIEYAFDGFGLCDQLKDLQDEIDILHNQTVDNRTLQNTLAFIERDGAISGDWEFYPGCRIKVDSIKDAIVQLQMGSPLPSAIGEELQGIQYMQLVAGVSPEAMGQPTAERPVASEAMARLQQVGIKLQFNMDVLRRKLCKIGMKALCQFAQYQPRFTYEVADKDGLFQAKVVDFPSTYLEEGVNIDLMASSEMLNSDVRKEMNIAVYQLMSDYVTKMASMIMALTQAGIHLELKKYIIEVAEQSRKIVNRILEDFDIPDADDLIKPLAEIIDVQNAIMKPTMPPPEEGGGEGGAPPQGMAPPQM